MSASGSACAPATTASATRATGASHRSKNGAFRVSVSSQRDDGYDAGITPLENGDAKRVDKLNSRTVFELSPANTLTVHAGGSRSRLDRPPESGLQELANYYDDSQQVGERAFFGLDWERQFSPRHQLKVSAYGQYTNEDNNLDLCFRDPLTGAPGSPAAACFLSQELRDLVPGQQQRHRPDPGRRRRRPGDTLQNRYATLQAEAAPQKAFRRRAAWLDTQETRYDLEIQDTLQVTDWARLVAGANLRHDRGESQAFLSGTGENVSRRLFANLGGEAGGAGDHQPGRLHGNTTTSMASTSAPAPASTGRWCAATPCAPPTPARCAPRTSTKTRRASICRSPT